MAERHDFTKNTLVVEAKKIGGDVPGWEPWFFEAVTGGILATGAICPIVTRGPNKGLPNYRKHDRATKSRVFIPAKPRTPEGTE